MRKNIAFFFASCCCLFLLIGCAGAGPSVIKNYSEARDRSQIAVLIVKQKMSLTVTACDGKYIPRSARYVLLQPGRHEVWFHISGQNLLMYYNMTNKKYLDAIGGHTYMLKSKGAGFFVVGDKWFPEVIDVTNDSKFHVANIPE
ncbi:MAG: hypothetical protein Q8O22_06915 [Candidatus Omnitrophota bacterium]|nr:hypothetical protein [Candidatus Omnitrophota bacterium]